MPIELNNKYKDYPIYAQRIETKADNSYFTDGEISVQIYIEDSKNFQDILDDGDFVVLKGGAGTKNDFHIVKLSIKDSTAYFEATSDLLTDLPCKKVLLEDIQEAPIYAKILFTISNRMSQSMLIDFYGIPSHHMQTNEEPQKPHHFQLSLPSEK